MDDEVIVVEDDKAYRVRAAKHSRLWPLRWETFEWNRVLVLAAMRSGVVDYLKDKNTHGKLMSTQGILRENVWKLAATEVTGFDQIGEPLEGFLHFRRLWKRLLDIICTYRDGKGYTAGMTETEWQSFLRWGSNGQGGSKKQRVLRDYCTLLAWIPAGEDGSRYPTDARLVVQGREVDLHLQVLLDALEVHSTGVDQKKANKGKEALKTARKDAQSLAAER